MSLEDAPDQTLRQLMGRLQTLESEWTITTTRARRREIDEEFKALSAKVRDEFGIEGERAINELLAKHKERRWF